MENANLEKWKSAALALKDAPSERPRVPLHVLQGEAVDVARFFERYWPSQVSDGVVVKPGLETAARDGHLHAGTGQEILELQAAVQEAQTNYLLRAEAAAASPMDRAQFILREISATLEYLFDDGQVDDDDARLERLDEQHNEAFSQDAVAAALDDYAGLAEMHRAQMDGFGGFDAALIDEARQTARALRERSAERLINPNSEAQLAVELRDRLVHLLQERMDTVRAAGRFVFRSDTDIVRKVGSSYERRRRAARRNRSGTQPIVTPDGGSGTDSASTGTEGS